MKTRKKEEKNSSNQRFMRKVRMGRIKVTRTEYEKCFCLQKIQRKNSNEEEWKRSKRERVNEKNRN